MKPNGTVLNGFLIVYRKIQIRRLTLACYCNEQKGFQTNFYPQSTAVIIFSSKKVSRGHLLRSLMKCNRQRALC